MQTVSSLSIDATRQDAGPSFLAVLDRLDPSPVLVRWAGHMPYFVVASGLVLPERLSLGSAVVIALLYAIFCHFVALWIRSRPDRLRDPVSRAARVATGMLAVVTLLSLIAPVISSFMAGARWGSPDGLGFLAREMGSSRAELWATQFALMLPVASGFFLIQFITTRPAD
jgi:hypothetical protein